MAKQGRNAPEGERSAYEQMREGFAIVCPKECLNRWSHQAHQAGILTTFESPAAPSRPSKLMSGWHSAQTSAVTTENEGSSVGLSLRMVCQAALSGDLNISGHT